jgi:hypothetical protein
MKIAQGSPNNVVAMTRGDVKMIKRNGVITLILSRQRYLGNRQSNENK